MRPRQACMHGSSEAALPAPHSCTPAPALQRALQVQWQLVSAAAHLGFQLQWRFVQRAFRLPLAPRPLHHPLENLHVHAAAGRAVERRRSRSGRQGAGAWLASEAADGKLRGQRCGARKHARHRHARARREGTKVGGGGRHPRAAASMGAPAGTSRQAPLQAHLSAEMTSSRKPGVGCGSRTTTCRHRAGRGGAGAAA